MGATTEATKKAEAVDPGSEAGTAKQGSVARPEASLERERVEDAIIHARERRITADEFQMLWRKGVFTAEDRIELLNGRLIDMSPTGPPHGHTVDDLEELLATRIYGADAPPCRIRVQGPIELGPHGTPLPDLVLYDRDAPRDRHPHPEDIYLVVEVADSSLDYDRGVKASRYARAGIPEYWIVDVAEASVEVHRRPTGDEYDERIRHRTGDAVSISQLPDLDAIPVAHVFPDAASPETAS